VARSVLGGVGRIDTYHHTALDTPNEINVFAFRRLLEDPDLPAKVIYDEWLERRYGLAPGTEAAVGLRALLVRTFDVARHCYYTLGFWTWKKQSWIPETAAAIDHTLTGRSNALWDPSQKTLAARLTRPDPSLVRAILAEKAAAVSLAEENAKGLAGLR